MLRLRDRRRSVLDLADCYLQLERIPMDLRAAESTQRCMDGPTGSGTAIDRPAGGAPDA